MGQDSSRGRSPTHNGHHWPLACAHLAGCGVPQGGQSLATPQVTLWGSLEPCIKKLLPLQWATALGYVISGSSWSCVAWLTRAGHLGTWRISGASSVGHSGHLATWQISWTSSVGHSAHLVYEPVIPGVCQPGSGGRAYDTLSTVPQAWGLGVRASYPWCLPAWQWWKSLRTLTSMVSQPG